MEDPHPRRPSSAASRCELHPHDGNAFSGSFCPSCLRDRLSGLDLDSDSAPAPGRLSTSALSVRHRSSAAPPHPHPHPHPHPQSHHHLRRCSSFSARPTITSSSSSSSIKPIKMHILDLQSQSNTNSSNSNSKSKSKSNFWITKYWHHWRHPRPRPQPQPQPQPQPTNSDADPRFSIHHAPSAAARPSFECQPSRFSFDAPPRPSWDAHSASTRPLISSHPFHPLLSAPDLNAPALPAIHRFDDQIPLEHDGSAIPGSQSQTRDYYLDSSSSNRRRRSFERSASLRKMASQTHTETEHRSMPAFNSKVSPAGNAEFYQYHHAVAVANRDDIAMSGSFSSAFQFQDPCKSQVAPDKRQKKWTKGWNLWGLIQRKGNNKDQPANAAVASGHADHFLRCNSSVSARSSFSSYSAAGTGSMRRNSIDTININSLANSYNRRDEFVLERNRSARFSPGRFDNGMLRLYLTPTRGSQSGRRNSADRPVNTGSQSMSSRHVHRLY